MKATRMVALVFVTSMIGGCAIAPGMHMDVPDRKGVKIKEITPDVIREQSDIRRNRRRATAAPNYSDYEYRIGPQDILNITVWDHPELTIPAGEFRSAEAAGHLVAADGTIFYPYVGKVEVAGKTVEEVRRILTRAISRTIKNPQLDVRVASFRSQRAYVVGEVNSPGPQPITDVPLTVVEAINRAGDVTRDADVLGVTLTRNGQRYEIDLWGLYEDGVLSQNMLLRNGDILHVANSSQQKVFVLGEVQTPQALLMNQGRMTLAEAIGEAGGVDRLSSNPGRIYVIRGRPGDATIYHLDGSSPDALLLGDQFALGPRDVVYVGTAGVTRWNRVISQILPTAVLLRNLSDTDFDYNNN